MSRDDMDLLENLLALDEDEPPLSLAAKEDGVQELLQSNTDTSLFQAIQSRHEEKYSLNEVSTEEVTELLSTIRGSFDQEKMNALIQSCKSTVLDSIIGPFGLSKSMFDDKNGGNVQTIHNAKQGIYADQKYKYDENQRKNYDYKTARKEFMEKNRNSDGTFTDRYTGKTLNEKDVNVDHIFSIKDFHNNGGFMKDKEGKKAFASDSRNYAITDQGLNKSKLDSDLNSFKSTSANGRDEQNKDHFGIDDRRANPAHKKAKEAFDSHTPSNMEKAQFYAKETAKSGLNEAKNMGMQQALGLLMRELIGSIFDEALDIYKNGLKGGKLDASFFEVVKVRLRNIGKRVLAKWKDFVVAFKDGAISGFISNLVTTIINIFATTSKRVVRVIREGFFSILRAIKLLVNPPKGMTFKQAAHEATKLIASGLVITGGIFLEELVEKWIMSIPFLQPFGNIISSIIVGTVTGLTTTLVVFLIDKIDFFGVNADERHEYVLKKLESMLDNSITKAEDAVSIIESPKLVHLEG